MRIEKSYWGTKYVHFMTSSPFPFLCFIVFGIAILIVMATSIELNIIESYPISLETDGYSITVATNRDIPTGSAFAYTNRNEAMIRITIIGITDNNGNKHLGLSEADYTALVALKGSLSLEVPSGKESLLHRVFAKGGISNE